MWPICPSKVKLVEDVAPFSLLFKKKSFMILLWLLWKLGYSTTALYFDCGLLVFMGRFIPRDPISTVHNIHITSGPIHQKKIRGWLSFSWCYHLPLLRHMGVTTYPTCKHVMPSSRVCLQCYHHKCGWWWQNDKV